MRLCKYMRDCDRRNDDSDTSSPENDELTLPILPPFYALPPHSTLASLLYRTIILHHHAMNSTHLRSSSCLPSCLAILVEFDIGSLFSLPTPQFVYVIRKRIKLAPEKAIFIFVDEVLPPTAALMSSIYEEHK